MDFNEVMESIKKESGEIPRPLELLGQLDESLVVNHMADKKFAYSKKAIPQKYKALIALSVGIALDSPPEKSDAFRRGIPQEPHEIHFSFMLIIPSKLFE